MGRPPNTATMDVKHFRFNNRLVIRWMINGSIKIPLVLVRDNILRPIIEDSDVRKHAAQLEQVAMFGAGHYVRDQVKTRKMCVLIPQSHELGNDRRCTEWASIVCRKTRTTNPDKALAIIGRYRQRELPEFHTRVSQ